MMVRSCALKAFTQKPRSFATLRMTKAHGVRTGAGAVGFGARVKLHDRAGDTMIEVLAALLIVVLATLLLATMSVTAVNIINRSSAEMDKTYQVESGLAQAVANPGKPLPAGIAKSSAPVTLTVPGDSLSPLSLDVALFKSENGLLACYCIPPKAGA
ncbi:MAG: hypothetical protein RR955_05915 [Raoultibacter sp.]